MITMESVDDDDNNDDYMFVDPELVDSEESVDDIEDVPLTENDLEEIDENIKRAMGDVKEHANKQPLTTTVKPKGSKMKRSSDLPNVNGVNRGGNRGGPRVQRIQKSYVVRDVHSKYPTEIEEGVNSQPPEPITNALPEPLKSFLAILRSYMGHDPATVNFNAIDDRILRSTKAADESDSEHFQRLMSAMNILDGIKQSRVSTLQALIEMAQKDVNDDRQHQRYSDAIQVKRDKADSEIAKDTITSRLAEQELIEKSRRENHLGYLLRELEAKETRAKIANIDAFPNRPIPLLSVTRESTNFEKRNNYVQAKLLKCHVN